MFVSFNTSYPFSKKNKLVNTINLFKKHSFLLQLYPKYYIKNKETNFKRFFLRFFFFSLILNINNFAYSQYYNLNSIKNINYTKNGLKSITYTQGEGAKPKWGDFVKINYVIYLVTNFNIEKIDSTYERHIPYIFQHGSGQVIMGIEEAIHKMNKGSKKRIIIPDNLGYASPNLGPIPPSTLKREKLLKKNKIQNLKYNVLLMVDIELINIFPRL